MLGFFATLSLSQQTMKANYYVLDILCTFCWSHGVWSYTYALLQCVDTLV